MIYKKVLSKIINKCLNLIESKRFEKDIFISISEINQILDTTILEENLELLIEEKNNLYLNIIEELQYYIKN